MGLRREAQAVSGLIPAAGNSSLCDVRVLGGPKAAALDTAIGQKSSAARIRPRRGNDVFTERSGLSSLTPSESRENRLTARRSAMFGSLASTVSSTPIVCRVPALRATQREELLIVTCPCCQFGVETLRQLPRLTAHVVHLADEFRILLEYEIGHRWPSYASEMACESSDVLNRRIPDVGDTLAVGAEPYAALFVTAPIGLVPLVAVAAFSKKRGFFAVEELVVNPLAQPSRFCHQFVNFPKGVRKRRILGLHKGPPSLIRCNR
jgi:hypothetical protein